ncbi:glycosyltransferase [Picosynechococcus sp. NKBG042902]|uniref:glycosyltransferase n=1 Tax=Picosynechococcus sp. NKBG042902 TaxID=490193 RepID=UPI0004AA4399|nr:glycosyltransferase [Picosynechococcus sp. NKBG042902]
MKIAIISSTFLPSHDGVSITLLERLKVLSAQGHQVLCLVSSYQEVAAIYPRWADYVGDLFANVAIVPLPSVAWLGIPQERNPKRSSLRRIETELAQFQPDLIQVEEPERLWTTLFALPGWNYAQARNIPYIGCYRTNFVDYLQDYAPAWLIGPAKWAALALTRRLYGKCSVTLVGSYFIEQRLKQWQLENVVYMPVIGPPKIANPQALKQTNFFQQHYGLPDLDQRVKILFLGRLSPDKNWAFILKHLPELGRANITENFTLLVAGRGELAEAIAESEFAQTLPTVILGEVPHEQVPALLANVDLHVTASLKETFGRTVQESLYVGTPVLAPDCDWAQNLIEPGVNGCLFQPEDGEDFIQQLAQLIDSKGDRQRLQNNIQKQNQNREVQLDPSEQWVRYLETQIQSTG